MSSITCRLHALSLFHFNLCTCLKSFEKRNQRFCFVFVFFFNQVCTLNTSNNQYNCYTVDITIDTAFILQTYPLIQLLHCRNNHWYSRYTVEITLPNPNSHNNKKDRGLLWQSITGPFKGTSHVKFKLKIKFLNTWNRFQEQDLF